MEHIKPKYTVTGTGSIPIVKLAYFFQNNCHYMIITSITFHSCSRPVVCRIQAAQQMLTSMPEAKVI